MRTADAIFIKGMLWDRKSPGLKQTHEHAHTNKITDGQRKNQELGQQWGTRQARNTGTELPRVLFGQGGREGGAPPMTPLDFL